MQVMVISGASSDHLYGSRDRMLCPEAHSRLKLSIALSSGWTSVDALTRAVDSGTIAYAERQVRISSSKMAETSVRQSQPEVACEATYVPELDGWCI
jgi:hypothetical protein